MRDFEKWVAVSLLVGLAGCDLAGTNKAAENKVTTVTKTSTAAGRLCGANATYSRLKQTALAEAKRIRERDTESLDALADASVVRMENPLLESRDEALGLTVCSGRMILELPPGAGAAFDGRQRLAADITYSAQAAADGSGTVFKIDGGEPIVYRLAGFDPERGGTRTAEVDMPVTDRMPLPGDFKPARDASIPPLAPPPSPRPPAPPSSDERRARAAAEGVANDPQAEQTARAARMRIADQRATIARVREAASRRAEADARIAAERSARADRIAQARRDDRGERDIDAAPTRTARPSFSCRYARSRVEKQICGSNDLASRDRAMANVYTRANERSDGPTRRALSASRLRFLAYRDRCGSADCVAQAYEDRIDEINDIAGE